MCKSPLQTSPSRPWVLLLLIITGSSGWLFPILARSDNLRQSFLPTWKLLNHQEKQQFIAGYLYGWSDAAKVTDAAIAFAKDNPNKAVEGLEKIKSLYDLSQMNSELLVGAVDAFFSDPANQDSSLSVAITGIKKRLR